MARLKYYQKESELYSRNKKLTDNQACYVFKRLKNRYKFRQRLVFFGHRDSGRCGTWDIRLSHNPSTLIIAHEVSHAIVMKRFPENKIHHGKKHASTMKRIYNIIETNLNNWKSMADKKSHRRVLSDINREARKRLEIQEKKMPEHKLINVRKLIESWETKRKRAETYLKKLGRKERHLIKKVGRTT